MHKSKKCKRAKKSVSAASSRQMPSAPNSTMYEDLTSSDESAIVDKISPLTPTTNAVVEPNLDDAVQFVLSPAAIDRIFSDDPEMADEVGKRISSSENGQQIKKMSVKSALGPSVMIEKESGGDNEPSCGGSEVRIGAFETMGAMISVLSDQAPEEMLITEAIKVIESVEGTKRSFDAMIMKKAEEKSGESRQDLGPSVMKKVVIQQIDDAENIGNECEDKRLEKLGKKRRSDDSEGNDKEEEEKEEEVYDGRSGRKMIVCQTTEKLAMAMRFGKKDQWPRTVKIRNEIQSEVSLRLGDIVFVSKYNKLDKFNDWISNAFKINPEAEATAIPSVFQNALERRVGIIMNVLNNEWSGVPKLMDVAFPESEVLQRFYPHQLESEVDLTLLKPGVLVWVSFVRIQRPSDIAIGPKGMYITPADFEEVSQRELVTHQPCIGTGIQGLTEGYEFPFSKGESIKRCEEGVAAAVSGALLRAKAEMEEYSINTNLFLLENRKETIVVTFEHFVQEKRKFVNLTKVWAEDSAVIAKIKGAKKPCASGRVLDVYKTVINGMFVLQAKVMLTFQLAKKYDAESDFEHLSEGWETTLIPSESFQALELRMARFHGKEFSCLANGTDGTSRIWRILLSQMIGAEKNTSSEDSSCFERHPALRRLEGGQRHTAELMMDSKPRVVAQQAPPGSGKTYTLAAIVAALMENRGTKVLCLAPLNVAVVKMCEELVGALKTEGSDEIPLALFSGTGKAKYRDHLDKISGNLLEAVATDEEFWEKLQQKEKREVTRYLQSVKKRPRIAKEALIAEYVLNMEKRRVLCCTLGFAEQIGRLITDRNVVVLDEAGQGSFVQICSTLSSLVEMRKVLITGDRYQLSVNMQSTPEPVREGYGFDTILINLDNANGVDKTTLLTNYRSHWQIVACVEHMVYKPHGETLNHGPGSFRMLTDFFKMPVADSPILLIHQDTLMEHELTSYSATNSGQTRTVMELLELLDNFPGSIRIISLYAGQAAQIGIELKERGLESKIASMTSDAMQGHEADLTIIATTVSRQSNWTDWQRSNHAKDRKNEFWGDSQRVNVALSRGKHGMIVIGNLLQLGNSVIWSKFLEKALEFTVVTSPEIIRSLKNPKSRYIRGVLFDNFGESVQNYRFYADWSASAATAPSTSSWPAFSSNSSQYQRVVVQNPSNFPPMQQRQLPNPPTPSQVRRTFAPSRPELQCWRCKRIGHVSTRCTFPPTQSFN
ncbi:hypothetical protein niasHT_038603 [Heterodera trifolii]|uniref:CCHC-type domain-containing protein n=1 Tax=Heterodera trifolii TaxID=157864 RepID=A0ABD2I7G2_9BILA